MHLSGAIVNKILPEFLLDPKANALARRLVEEGDELERALGDNYLRLRTLAQRDSDLLGRIEELGAPLLATIPRLDRPVNDLKGLLEVGELLAGAA
jgi:hypothetical protein